MRIIRSVASTFYVSDNDDIDMKRILVPTDFSLPSIFAYRFALQLAEKANAEIHVVHVIEIPLLQETTFGIQPVARDPVLMRQIAQRVREASGRFIARYPSNRHVHFQSLEGNRISALQSFIDENRIDLVIMSPQGESDLNDFFLGSTAARFARYATVPVLFVPADIPTDSIKHIVFPNTLSLDQSDLVKDVQHLQELFDATLHVLFVNTPQHFLSDDESTGLLKRFAAYYHLDNYTLNCRNHQHESHAIAAFTEETPGALLAMATHGRRGLAHLLKGSIAESMVYALKTPVWIRKNKSNET